ncbi:dynamin family protein [Clostridium sp.]|uniref:dynamin family protein n=1 Tax=Clostridium sp. TaxID=1506 RepID=UPI0032169721
MKVTLNCNPYIRENIISVNGKEYKEKSSLEKYKDLYVYQFGEAFIEDLVNELNNKSIEITFNGSMYDFEELSNLIKISNIKRNYNLSIKKDKIIRNLERRAEVQALLEILKKSNIKEFNDAQLTEKIEKALNKNIEIAVVAPMSSGKSTLINAFIGDKVMPSAQRACTATIVNLFNDKDASKFKIINKNGKPCKEEVNLEKLKELNSDEDVKTIDIIGRIQGLLNVTNAKIVDTPGPNNAMNEGHKKVTMEYLKGSEKPIILFLMKCDDQTSDAVKSLIKIIADEIKENGKIDSDRFLFVVNKCDGISEDEEGSVDSIIEDSINFIEECGVLNPRIHFISASHALLTRMEEANKLSKKDKILLNSIYSLIEEDEYYEFYKASIYDERLKAEIEQEYEEAKENEDILKQAFILSGVASLEKNIIDIINQHKTVKLVGEIVEECKNTIDAQNLKKKLMESIQKGQEEREKIKESIRKVEEILSNKDIKNNLEMEINNIRFGNSFTKVINRINAEVRTVQQLTDSLQEKEVGEGSNLSISSFFNRNNKTVEEKPRYVDKKVALNHLKKVNEKVMDLKIDLETEYERFIKVEIHEVGTSLIEKYKKSLQIVINDIKGIDTEISQLVNVSLPSYTEFLNDKTVTKSESYSDIVKNPEREGFLGFFKVWKPKTIEVTKYKDINVIDKEEIKIFTKDIATKFQYISTEMSANANKEKDFVKKVLIENFNVFDNKISENMENMKALAHNVAELEVAISSDIQVENRLNDVIDKLERIIEI